MSWTDIDAGLNVCRAPPKYGRGQADSVLLAEHPPLPKLAATPLGEKVDLSVVGTADDGQVQVSRRQAWKHPLANVEHYSIIMHGVFGTRVLGEPACFGMHNLVAPGLAERRGHVVVESGVPGEGRGVCGRTK